MKYCSRAMIIRTAWLYSIYGNNFVKTMLRLGRERETLGVVFDQIGTPTYANDLARAIFAAVNRGIVPGVYHFSNEGVCSWYDFTLAIHRLGGIKTCKVSPLHTDEFPAKAPRPHYSPSKRMLGPLPHWRMHGTSFTSTLPRYASASWASCPRREQFGPAQTSST